MKLTINGNVNLYYVQTLCMLFFPGAKFSEKAQDGDKSELILDFTEDGTSYYAEAVMKSGEKEARGIGTAEAGEEFSVLRAKKMAIGRAVFEAGKELFGITPPFGVLTGVRPSKVASEYLVSAGGIKKTQQILKNEYFLNQKKAALCTSVASTELKVYKTLADNGCSVYISIPFCPSRCAYCSFVSYTTPRLLSMIDEYLVALKLEISAVFSHIKKVGKKVETIYIGGGTPTVLNDLQLRDLLSHIFSCYDIGSVREFTLEAGRPDTITAEKLAIAKEYGVGRISVNPQSLSDAVLQAAGRKHTALEFFSAYEIARESGIPCINVDLIAGLPEDNFTRFSRTIDKIIDLSPENITVHSFCIKKSADFTIENENATSLFALDAAKCIDYSQVKMRTSGYKPYYMYRQKNTVGNLENVGFSREGFEGIYNIVMMEEYHSVYGAGAGAVTKLVTYDPAKEGRGKIRRIINPKYPYEYLRDIKDEAFLLSRLAEAESEFSIKSEG